MKLSKTKNTATSDVLQRSGVPPVGAEQTHESSGKSQVAVQGDAESDAVCVVSDPWLARLIEIWPALPDDVWDEILTLAGLRR